jgi:hypothetical protein
MIKLAALVAAVGGLGAVVYSQLPEVRRYLRVRKM